MNRKTKSHFGIENIKKILPSKKVGSVVLSVLVIFVAILSYMSFKNVSYNSSTSDILTVSGAIDKDTDADGVPDWEERLWGTDPRNNDTDGDGVPDFTEIASRKDSLAAANGFGTSTYTLSETDIFARELFVTYSALSEQGSLKGTASDGLASAALSTAAKNVPKIILNSATDLKIVPQTESSNKIYRQSITDLSKVKGGVLGTEFALVNQGVIQNNGDVLRDLTSYTDAYNAYKVALLKIPVPANQVENHVRLLNNLNYISNTLPQMSYIQDDVIKGVPLYTVYIKSYQDMFSTFEIIGKTN